MPDAPLIAVTGASGIVGGAIAARPADAGARQRASYGAPDWEVEGWVSSYQAIRDGSLDVVSHVFAELTGLQPQTLEEHLGSTV